MVQHYWTCRICVKQTACSKKKNSVFKMGMIIIALALFASGSIATDALMFKHVGDCNHNGHKLKK